MTRLECCSLVNSTTADPYLSLQPRLLLFFLFTMLQSPRSLLFSSHQPHSFSALRLFHKIVPPRKFFPSAHGCLLALSRIMVNITSLRRPQSEAQNRLRPSVTATFFPYNYCICCTAHSPNRLRLQEGRTCIDLGHHIIHGH